ncbi:hypothetical protein KNE206_51470 [Kitasatospora sp. NE20-6]
MEDRVVRERTRTAQNGRRLQLALGAPGEDHVDLALQLRKDLVLGKAEFSAQGDPSAIGASTTSGGSVAHGDAQRINGQARPTADGGHGPRTGGSALAPAGGTITPEVFDMPTICADS